MAAALSLALFGIFFSLQLCFSVSNSDKINNFFSFLLYSLYIFSPYTIKPLRLYRNLRKHAFLEKGCALKPLPSFLKTVKGNRGLESLRGEVDGQIKTEKKMKSDRIKRRWNWGRSCVVFVKPTVRHASAENDFHNM